MKKPTKKIRTTGSNRRAAKKAKSRIKMPDFMGRMRAIYGDTIFQVSGADLIREDRDR